MNNQIVICDHGFVEASLVPEQWLDAPGLCPRGIYETILWENGNLVALGEHLERFARGCRYLGVAPWNVTREQIVELVDHNGMDQRRARVRLMCFSEAQSSPGAGSLLHLGAIRPAPAPGMLPDFRCVVSAYRRAAQDLSYQFKLTARAEVPGDLANAEARGFHDVLYFNDRDEACEAAYSNLWVLKKKQLFTPPVSAPCLPGIVRKRVMETAECAGLVAIEHSMRARDLEDADAVFLTSSIRGFQPVVCIDGIWSARTDSLAAEKLMRLQEHFRSN